MRKKTKTTGRLSCGRKKRAIDGKKCNSAYFMIIGGWKMGQFNACVTNDKVWESRIVEWFVVFIICCLYIYIYI